MSEQGTAPLSAEELLEGRAYAEAYVAEDDHDQWLHKQEAGAWRIFLRLLAEHAALGQRVAELEREVGLLERVAANAREWRKDHHPSYREQLWASLDALDAAREAGARKGGERG